MATEKMIRRAKVTLTKGKTYTLAGRKFIRNVPVTVKGSMCDEFHTNGRFSCVELDPKLSKKKMKKDSSSSDEGDSKKSKKNKSKKKLKSSNKKKVK